MKRAMFAAGCFWGIQHAFKKIPGVKQTTVGYSGGTIENPSYEMVCRTETGHAEAVLIEYDPNALRYETLLDAFWEMHDPTTLNRQGPDVGTQYRSAIFYFDEEQKQAAELSKVAQQGTGKFKNPIVTEIQPAGEFWKAEDYHQDYVDKQGGH